MFSKKFYRFAALCAIISGVTTFLLWALPFGYQDGKVSSASLHTNNFYLARWWVNFFHVFFALFAYWAVVAKKMRTEAGAVSLGFICFLIWGITELLGVSVLLFAVNFNWRTNLAAATDQAAKSALEANIGIFADVWDAMFFLLLAAFLGGSLFYGISFIRNSGLEKIVGICFLLAVPLTFFIILGGYTSFMFFDPLVLYLYPVLQPVSRILLGFWLLSPPSGDHEDLSAV